jgi:hypothetical protein
MIFKLFTSHPESVGESYWQHFGFATSTGAAMMLGGLACITHGLFPFLFTRTGSKTIARLYERMSSGARHKVMATNHAELDRLPAEWNRG